jgi:hypothetical protein
MAATTASGGGDDDNDDRLGRSLVHAKEVLMLTGNSVHTATVGEKVDQTSNT